MQTDDQLREDPNDLFVQTFESGKMDSNFAIEHALLIGLASFARHHDPNASETSSLAIVTFMLRLAADGAMFKIEHLSCDARWRGLCGMETRWRLGEAGLELLVQDNAKERAIHLQPTVVVDEAQLSEFVHEEIHS